MVNAFCHSKNNSSRSKIRTRIKKTVPNEGLGKSMNFRNQIVNLENRVKFVNRKDVLIYSYL
jgi:ribosomal protein S20